MPNYSGIWTEQAMMQAVAAGTWASLPGAPTIGTATSLGATSASVAFTAPTFLGLPAVITSYTVTSSPGGITATGATSPITVTGLTEGTPYTFTVSATNASGTGAASAASNSVTPVQINYIEDTFSTWLYTGTGSDPLVVNNGIDLAGKGGLLWMKSRSSAFGHALFDTVRGVASVINSNTTAAASAAIPINSFTSSGFSLSANSAAYNGAGGSYVSWTFRDQPKFFDVVTYTGNGVAGRTVAHNLGSEPGCMFVKCTSAINDWQVYHQSTAAGMGPNKFMVLNSTAAESTGNDRWNNTAPTSSVFTVGNAPETNQNGATYVAYLFANDAGGFGLSGNENVISCGGYAGNGSTTSRQIDLGYEPQWLLIRSSTLGMGWYIVDNMRGFSAMRLGNLELRANSSAAEGADFTPDGCPVTLNATGFNAAAGSNYFNSSGNSFIYIAIRRGPMKVPTTGTSIFEPFETTNSTSAQVVGSLSQPDMFLSKRTDGDQTWRLIDRLRSGSMLRTDSTDSESVATNFLEWDVQAGVQVTVEGAPYVTNDLQAHWLFRRAPGFFDEVCWLGTGTTSRVLSHNLGVVPGMIIFKDRNNASGEWYVQGSEIGGLSFRLFLSQDAAQTTGGGTVFSDASATTLTTSTTNTFTNPSGRNCIAYLFATCPGVSKVGSYTGTGATQVINCGFAAGARFVLIKATSTTGDWLVWDSARGIVAGNDPYLALNTSVAEVTGTDWVDTAATGFELSNAGGNLANSSGVSYIFLAIA